MKVYKKQIKISLVFFVFLVYIILKPSNAGSCKPIKCPGTSNKDDPTTVKYPFHINDRQPESCGIPVLTLYCNESLGTLLRLPNSVVLKVDNIVYNHRQVLLSDPYKYCLPQILMAIDYTKIPFYPYGAIKKFRVYNCSGDDYDNVKYDRIDCLSGNDYHVISFGLEIIVNVSENCTFVKLLTVPASHNEVDLSSISGIALSWNETSAMPKSTKSKASKAIAWIVGFLGMVFLILICWYRFRMQSNFLFISTIRTAMPTTSTNVVPGLDQATIDSYSIEVVSDSGRFSGLQGDPCSICHMDYMAREILRTLPGCLHRFHAKCIDEWLLRKGDCPICRAVLPRISYVEGGII